MNQDQRKYLVAAVEKQGCLQRKKLQDQLTVKPSLNNYLTAAFLDNSIQFADIGELKKKMRAEVLKYGTKDRLVAEPDRWNNQSKDKDTVNVLAADLFIIPTEYISALAEYEKQNAAIDKQIEDLDATQQTIIMKIQIGSSAALEKLVMQIDNIGDLSLVNTQLMIGAGPGKEGTDDK